jgi:hypothetical protein
LKPFERLAKRFTNKVENRKESRFEKWFNVSGEGFGNEKVIEVYDVVLKSKARL